MATYQNPNINRNISYTNRGFTSLRSELINFTQTYIFPTFVIKMTIRF